MDFLVQNALKTAETTEQPNEIEVGQANIKVIAWVRKIIPKMPKRCTVFFFTDGHARLGQTANGMSCLPEIGECNQEIDNFNGKNLRDMLCDLELTAINTFFDIEAVRLEGSTPGWPFGS